MWYNQTEVATKEELENVKGLIDVSAKIVYSTNIKHRVDSVDIPVDYDYVIITVVSYESKMIHDTDSPIGMVSQVNVTVNKGGTADIPVVYEVQAHTYFEIVTVTALSSSISFDCNVKRTDYVGITIVAYKY